MTTLAAVLFAHPETHTLHPNTIHANRRRIRHVVDDFDIPLDLRRSTRHLHLSFNQLASSELRTIAHSFPHLTHLSLERNRITALSDVLYLSHQLPDLQTLSLNGNPVQGTPLYQEYLIVHFPRLRMLDGEPVTDRPQCKEVISHVDAHLFGLLDQAVLTDKLDLILRYLHVHAELRTTIQVCPPCRVAPWVGMEARTASQRHPGGGRQGQVANRRRDTDRPRYSPQPSLHRHQNRIRHQLQSRDHRTRDITGTQRGHAGRRPATFCSQSTHNRQSNGLDLRDLSEEPAHNPVTAARLMRVWTWDEFVSECFQISLSWRLLKLADSQTSRRHHRKLYRHQHHASNGLVRRKLQRSRVESWEAAFGNVAKVVHARMSRLLVKVDNACASYAQVTKLSESTVGRIRLKVGIAHGAKTRENYPAVTQPPHAWLSSSPVIPSPKMTASSFTEQTPLTLPSRASGADSHIHEEQQVVKVLDFDTFEQFTSPLSTYGSGSVTELDCSGTETPYNLDPEEWSSPATEQTVVA